MCAYFFENFCELRELLMELKIYNFPIFQKLNLRSIFIFNRNIWFLYLTFFYPEIFIGRQRTQIYYFDFTNKFDGVYLALEKTVGNGSEMACIPPVIGNTLYIRLIYEM